jgi:hypothetical protein
MPTFTTWTALLTQLLDDLASGSFRTKSYSTPTGVSVTYNAPEEILAAIREVRTLAAFETGAASPRTYAGQGGRGGIE